MKFLYLITFIAETVFVIALDSDTSDGTDSQLSRNQNTNHTLPGQKSNLIAGLEPGAFYSGVVLLVLLLICLVLCGCLLSNKKTTTTIVSPSEQKDPKTEGNTNTEVQLSEVKVETTQS